MTRTPLSRSKGQRSKSPGHLTHHRAGASGSCSGRRRNVLAVGNCSEIAVCSAARGAAPTGEERGGGTSWRPPAYSLFIKPSRLCAVGSVPHMYDCPSLVGPTVINRTQIEFYCDIKTNETDSAARFNVSFLFDYQQDDDVPVQVVTADNARATLHERYLANRLNKRVSGMTGATLSDILNNNNSNHNHNHKLMRG